MFLKLSKHKIRLSIDPTDFRVFARSSSYLHKNFKSIPPSHTRRRHIYPACFARYQGQQKQWRGGGEGGGQSVLTAVVILDNESYLASIDWKVGQSGKWCPTNTPLIASKYRAISELETRTGADWGSGSYRRPAEQRKMCQGWPGREEATAIAECGRWDL